MGKFAQNQTDFFKQERSKMTTRREFLVMSAGAMAAAMLPVYAFAQGENAPLNATAITQVFGDGVKLTAVAVEYAEPLENTALQAADFQVAGRTVTKVYTAQSAELTASENGKFVIICLSEEDENTSLAETVSSEPSGQESKPQMQGGKPNWVAGQKMTKTVRYKEAQAEISINGKTLQTNGVKNLIADSFQQAEFVDSETGKTLMYNLFSPAKTEKLLPLVLFMHDAGVTSEQQRATLFQGLGAIIWADPAEQAKRPCFVLAPQFDEIIADDDWRTSDYLGCTIRLIKKLIQEQAIDPNRIYVTGQSGGCMLATAMNIAYPDFFAASYLVAGKWDPQAVAPMAKQKIWWLASEDDLGAFPSFNAITATLGNAGTKISRAVWNGTWNADQYRFAYDILTAENAQMYYTVFVKESVFRPTDSRQGASGHRNTWRLAYSIEPIREWLFAQHK